MQPVTTALIGLGYWGPNLLRNFGAQSLCHLKYACDLRDENIAKAKAHYPAVTFTKDAAQIFADSAVELVLIATPTKSHFPLAKAALEAGKHVFIEKPMCASTAEAKELNAIAASMKKFIFIDHTFAFAPSVAKMRTYAKEGALGDLLYFDSTRINLGIIQPDTNVLFDLAIHDLTILSTVKDLTKVKELCAHGTQYYGKQVEVGHLHMTFDDGFMAHISVSWLSPVKIRHTILAGTKAMVTYDDTEPSEKVRLYDKGVVHDTNKPNPMLPTYRSGDVLIPALPPKETLGLEAAHVLQCIRENGKPIVSGEDGLAVLTILEKADESLRTGATVKL
ncbi:MAG: Gfo/Idh/MocA family oxidoreductase [Candidatus Peribacteraceae bacterium]|nr:Gfo/Idh/MocA family oxidoreductase [Candidatus Peribacteraceae bacterium]